jgi:hypothetical protein
MLLFITVTNFTRRANPPVDKQKEDDMSLVPTRDMLAHPFYCDKPNLTAGAKPNFYKEDL